MKKLYLPLMAALATTLSAAAYNTVTFDPAPGTSMKYIETIDFNYPTYVDGIDLQKVYITDESTGEKTYCSSFATFTDYTKYMMGGTMTFPKISDAGTYTLTMEEGAVHEWFSGDTNALETAQYIVNPDAEEVTIYTSYNLTPAPESPVAMLYRLQIDFPKIGYYDIAATDESKASLITLTGNGKTYYASDFSGSYGSYSFYFSETAGGTAVEITEPGEYSLFIPAGLINNNEEDPEAFKGNPEIIADYTVSNDIDFQYTCEPESGSVISIAHLDNLTVKIYFGDEVNSISLEPAIEGASFDVTLNGSVLAEVSNVNEEEGYMIEKFGTSLSIRLSKSLVTEPSEFHIVAPKGAFTVDGLPSPAIDYIVTYTPPKEFTYTITPTPDIQVVPFSDVTIYFTNAESIYRPYYCRDTAGKMTSIRPGSTPINSSSVQVINPDEEGGYPTLVVTFPEVLQDDNYIFTFPKGEVLLEGDDSPAIECLFKVDSSVNVAMTGVNGFSASAANRGQIRISNPEGLEVNVFSLDGRKICRLADRNAIVSVNPGCYVVVADGKSVKLVVK